MEGIAELDRAVKMRERRSRRWAHLEGIAEVQHGGAGADKLAAAVEAALDDSKELAAGLQDIGLLGILHGLPALLLHQSLHSLPELLLFSVHIHTASTA